MLRLLGVSGDHFRFLVELDGISIPERVERLAPQAGLPMPVLTAQDREREQKRATLHDVMEMATAFFEAQLQGAPAPRPIHLREPRPQRQDPADIPPRLSPDSRNGLKEHLASKGRDREQMEACGLVRAGRTFRVL